MPRSTRNGFSRSTAITERREPQRKVIHIDMDAFFASVEQRDNPAWRGRPVIVGGDPSGRGVVAAASYEARAFGVRSAMPARHALTLCPDAVFVRPRIDAYRAVSAEIMAVFRRYTDLVEPLSLDEACLDVTRNHVDEPIASRLARRIRADILETTGLTASAGVAPNRFLAKVAADLNKPDGQTVVPPEKVPELMQDLPVARIPGVGPVMQKRLAALGIRTAGELQSWDKAELQTRFGRFGLILYERCRGIDDRPIGLPRQRKSVSVETTFAHDLTDPEKLHAALDDLWARLIRRAQRLNWQIQAVTVKCRFADFRTISRQRSLTTPVPVADAGAIASGILDQILAEHDDSVRLLGIGLSPPAAALRQQLRLPFPAESQSSSPGTAPPDAGSLSR